MNFLNGIEYENRVVSINLDMVESVNWTFVKDESLQYNLQYNETTKQTTYTYYSDSHPINAVVYLQGSRSYFYISEHSSVFTLYEKIFNKTITPKSGTVVTEEKSDNTSVNQQYPGSDLDIQL
jgi:hypothetical protein